MNQNNEDDLNKKYSEEVMAEAEEYCSLAKEYRANRCKEGEEFVHILNRKWLRKWKEYVNYPFIKRKMQYYQQYMQRNLKPYLPDANLRPGLIENMEILEPLQNFLNDGNLNDQSNLIIRSNINQKDEVKICGKKVWEFFFRKYGGGPEITKPWIYQSFSIYNNKKIIELFSRNVNVLTLPARREISKENIYSMNSFSLYVSRNKNLSEIKERFIEILVNIKKNNQERLEGKSLIDNCIENANINTQNFKIWKINPESNLDEFKEYLLKNLDEIVNTDTELNPGELLSFLEYTTDRALKDEEFADSDIGVLEYVSDSSPAIFEVKKIEMREAKCYWCNEYKLLKIFCVCKEIGYCSAYCKTRGSLSHSSSCKRGFVVEQDSLVISPNSRQGLTGLQNLGNTCFMNTSLQCLSNCPELTKYFIEDGYEEHINTENPIGTQGVLAKAYSNLLKNLWYGSSTVYSPWNFKTAIERFQPIFIGYQQHDTQEFLNYLLDGLHEDLNKVYNKPIVEKDDAIKDDIIKSKEQWLGFLKRNQSILVDLLYGQYKSTLYCPDRNCQNISTTFDPFVSISLPLTSSVQKYQVTCFFLFYELSIAPIKLTLSFSMETTIMALRNKISKLINVDPFSFMIVKMDRIGNLDNFVNSSMILKMHSEKLLHKNQTPFLCFQIDPNIFYSKLNNSLPDLDFTEKKDFSKLYEELIKKSEEKRYLFEEEYDEDRTGQTKENLCYYSKFSILIDGKIKPVALKINTDNNNGLGEDLIKVVLNMKKYDDIMNNRKKLVFSRIIYLNKNWTTKAVHLLLSNYFSHILRKRSPLDCFDVRDTFFPEFEEITRDVFSMSYTEHKRKGFPYLIRIKNIFTNIGGYCIFCKRSVCEDCLLPCRDDITIRDILDKIPKNHEMPIDNTYYYMNEKQRDACQVTETEFVLDIAWLKEYESLLKTLNEKPDFEFESKEAQNSGSISINSCFRNFVKLEKLEEDNEWYCRQCKTHQRAEKKMEIYNSPQILTIHLKRFKNNSKLDTLVDFPINGLDISNHVIYKEKQHPMIYDLFAIANHYGSLNGGHYVAYAKNRDIWYSFNDSSVSQIDESQLITSSAYVLFYRRRDLDKYLNLESLYKKPFVNYENVDIEQTDSATSKNEDNSNSNESLKSEMRMMEICDDVITYEKIL